MSDETQTIHASCVAFNRAGVLILGASGAGKSALALQLMALGAALVADDRVILGRDGDAVFADCPPPLLGLIEARGIGILRAQPHPPVKLGLVVDLDQSETQRFPQKRRYLALGAPIDLVFNCGGGHLPAAVLQILKSGRAE